MTAIAGGGIRTNRHSNQRSISTGIVAGTLLPSHGTGAAGQVSGGDARFASPGVGESRGGFEQSGGLVYDWLTEPAAPPVEAIGDADGTGAASAVGERVLEATASASGIGAASAVGETPTVFIGTATVLGNDNSPGNKTFSANGGTNLPPCLFVCGFLTATSDDPSVFQIGATNLVKVANDSINFLQLWAADYAGGSDTITVGDGSVYDEINVAPGWATAGFSPTAVSPQSEEYGTGGASAAAHRILSPNCEIPTGGVGFVVGGTTHFAKAAGTPNWANCETSPAPSNGYAVDYARISLACKATAGSWQPEFWGSGASDYTDSTGLAACAFASTAGVPSAADGAAAGAGAASGVGAEITILRPDGDTALDGWTNQADGTSNIYQSIDEATASDADYVQSPAIVVAGASPEVQQFLDRATGMDSTHIDAFTALIDGIVSDGEWAGLDGLWIGATDTEAHSFLNLKENTGTYDLTILTNGVESIVQTADQGWTTTGLNSSLDTGYTIGDGNAVQDSTAYGYYNLTSSTSADSAVAMGTIASNYLCIIMNQGGSTYCMASDATFLNTTALNHQGMFVASRTTSSALAAYRNSNSTAVISGSATSGTPSAFSITLLAANSDGTGANLSRFTADTIAAAFIGSELDSAGAVRISNRINAYMTAVGANVY